MGVWIETMAQARASMMNAVTPCVGVWIETLRCNLLGGLLMSHPAWVCGLKLIVLSLWMMHWSHTLRGCVD